MIVEGEFTFDGPRPTVWAMLLDPEVLVKALPGAKELTRVDENSYQGRMHVGVGPVTAAEFEVQVRIEEMDEPERYVMLVDGKGQVGFTKGRAVVELRDAEGERTTMSYRADLQIGGRIAGVGQRLLDSASRAMARQGLERVNQELRLRLGVTEVAAGGGGMLLGRRPVQLAAAVLLFVSLFFLCGPQ